MGLATLRALRAEGNTLKGNEAVASVAHRLSEVIAIYWNTPRSPIGEVADEWLAAIRETLAHPAVLHPSA